MIYVSTIFLFRTFAVVCFHSLFVSRKIECETLCKFLYIYAGLKCMFMQSIMVNRKLFGNFEFSAPLPQTFYLFTFYFFAFSLILDNLQKIETETKKQYFCRFCGYTSLFVANNVLIFRDLHLYRANHTPPPPFLALAGWVSSLPKIFYFFIFIFFVKYYDFANSAFLPNFEHF